MLECHACGQLIALLHYCCYYLNDIERAFYTHVYRILLYLSISQLKNDSAEEKRGGLNLNCSNDGGKIPTRQREKRVWMVVMVVTMLIMVVIIALVVLFV